MSKGLFSTRRGWQPYHLILLLVVSIALLLRLWEVGSAGLWFDEMGQALVARLQFLEILPAIKEHYGAAPLDYVITAFVTRIASTDAALRLPAVLWGTLSVWGIARLGMRVHSPQAGIVAAALLTFSAFHIRYSQELRFYALFVLLAILSTDILLSAWESNRRGSWVLYGSSILLLLYTHYFAVFILLFHGTWCALTWIRAGDLTVARRRDGRLISFILATGIPLLLFLPWAIYDFPQDSNFTNVPVFDWDLVRSVFVTFSGGSYGWTGPVQAAGDERWWQIWLIMAVIGQIYLLKKDLNLGIMFALWTLLPLPTVVLLDRLNRYFFAERQIIFVLPIFLLLVAIGISESSALISRILSPRVGNERPLPIFLLIIATIALGLTSWPTTQFYLSERGWHEDWQGMASVLASNVNDQEEVVIIKGTQGFVDYYVPSEIRQRQTVAKGIEDIEAIYQSGQPFWLATSLPMIGLHPDSERINAWMDENVIVDFTFRGGLKLGYFDHESDQAGRRARLQQLTLPSPNPELLIALAYALASVQAEEAADLFEQALTMIESSQDQYRLLMDTGDVAMRRQDYETALDLYERALASRPQNEARVKIGFLHLQLNEPDLAYAFLSTAAQEGYDDYYSNRWLGMALSRLNRPQEAIVHFDRALAFAPESHDLRYHIGVQYALLGDRSQAEIWWRDYLAHDPEGVWANDVRQRLQSQDDS